MSMEIDESVHFNRSTVEDIANLGFNPGGSSAQFKSVESGISFLTCTPCTEAEMEVIRRRDDAEHRSEGNRIIEESLGLSVIDPNTAH